MRKIPHSQKNKLDLLLFMWYYQDMLHVVCSTVLPLHRDTVLPLDGIEARNGLEIR